MVFKHNFFVVFDRTAAEVGLDVMYLVCVAGLSMETIAVFTLTGILNF
jgi:hypothetical protein